MDGMLYNALALIVPLVIAVVFHEVSHGYVARLLGDPTAHERRRLSLNPLRHVDPVGTVLLPGGLALAGLPVFGWAKPVPVDARRLRNPRFGMMAVAAAGPLSNFVMAGIAAIALGFLLQPYGPLQQPGEVVDFVAKNLINFIAINIFLALFNLLPIPPFDGSHIVEGLLPRAAARHYAALRQYGLLAMILLLVVVPYIAPQWGIVDRLVGPPFDWVQAWYIKLTSLIAGN
ncbi:MAG: site-2 protease family protein [Novosphingobium sp.]|nr:site-2 protease family protein [Novosphingobium sp.]